LASSQESTVQETPSLQLTGVPGWQPNVGWHVSTPSQYSPLLHKALFTVCLQDCVASSQESVVQATPSSQLGGVPGLQPVAGSQVSVPLQNNPSPQSLTNVTSVVVQAVHGTVVPLSRIFTPTVCVVVVVMVTQQG
jgi:hypothetical protein